MIAAYIIHHPITNLIYFGSTVWFRHRQSQHLSALRKNRHRNRDLQAAYNKDPNINWIPKEMPTLEMARELEQLMIDGNKGNPYMANMFGAKPRDRDVVNRIIASNTGKKRTPEQCDAMSKRMFGVKHSQEAKNKMSTTRKGVSKPPGYIDKLAQVNSKPVSIEGKLYPSVTRASAILGVPEKTMSYRLHSGSKKFKEWIFINAP